MIVDSNGSDRIVFEHGEHVWKVARTQPVRAGRELVRVASSYGMRNAEKTLRMNADVYQSPRWELAHGLVANRREHRLAVNYPDLVIATTSLAGGIINKQRKVRTLDSFEGSRDCILNAFRGSVGIRIPILGHMLEQASNFGIDPDDGAVKFVDGGSRGLEQMLEEEKRGRDIQLALENVRAILNEG